MTRGFSLKLEKNLSKGQFIELCKDLEVQFGEGNRFEPLRGKGLLWADWPGRDPSAMGSKELRLMVHSHSTMPYVVWPVDCENARTLWEDDPSMVMRQGRYATQLVSYGAAPKWRRLELELLRECLQKLGFKVCVFYNHFLLTEICESNTNGQVGTVNCIRRLRYKDDALERVGKRFR